MIAKLPSKRGEFRSSKNLERKQSYVWDLASNLFLGHFSVYPSCRIIKILREYERGVIFRLGRLIGAKGPGIIFIIPGVDKLLRISLRTVALEIPSQDVITRDNISSHPSRIILITHERGKYAIQRKKRTHRRFKR